MKQVVFVAIQSRWSETLRKPRRESVRQGRAREGFMTLAEARAMREDYRTSGVRLQFTVCDKH
jgi:hypothetical protein